MSKKRVLTEAEKERARIRARAWYATNKERAKAANVKWRKANEAAHKAYKAKWHQDNKERLAPARAAWTAANKEHLKETNRKWREANKDRIKEQRRAYQKANKAALNAKSAEYNRLHPEARAARYARYAEKHADRLKVERKAYYLANQDRLRIAGRKRAALKSPENVERVRRWRIANPERYATHAHTRRSRTRTPMSPAKVAEIFATRICHYCGVGITIGGKRAFDCKTTIDHRTPISRGGDNDDDNLVASCFDCNVRKNDRTDDEYFVYLSEARAVLDDVMSELLVR